MALEVANPSGVEAGLENEVSEAVSDDFEGVLKPAPSSDRPGLLRVSEGRVHTHHLDRYEVVGIGQSNVRGETFVHFK